MISLISAIMEKIGKIDYLENLKGYPELKKKNRIMTIYSTSAIEGNLLSLESVDDILNGMNIICYGKGVLEIKNTEKAYDVIEKINPLKEDQLLKVHSILGTDLISLPGQYRTEDELVANGSGEIIYIAPSPDSVKSLMNELFKKLKEDFKTVSPLIISCYFHYKFVYIHPFTDGNGRMARYWQTAILGKWKPIFYYLPIEKQILKYQSEYYSIIQNTNKSHNLNDFIEFMLNMIDKALSDLINNTNHSIYNDSICLNKLLKKLKINTWYSSNQILELLNLRSKLNLRKNYVNPGLANGILIMEYPNKPTTKNQRYKVIKKG